LYGAIASGQTCARPAFSIRDTWALLITYVVCLGPLIASFIVVARCREIARLVGQPERPILFAGQIAIVALGTTFILFTLALAILRPRWIIPESKKQLLSVQAILSLPALIVMALTHVDVVATSQFCGLFTISFAAVALAAMAISVAGFSKTVIVAAMCGVGIQLWLGEPRFMLRHTSDHQVEGLLQEIRGAWDQFERAPEGKSWSPPATDQVLGKRGIPTFTAALSKWLDTRPNLPGFPPTKEPYPIFIVAAQGGGYQAAYHTSLFLAKILDACPSFANHVFAISSVSGGALGAAVFTEILRSIAGSSETHNQREQCGTRSAEVGPAERITQTFFSHDFLTPILTAAFFVDGPRYIIPLPYTRLDRAIAFEKAIEAAWQGSAPGSAKGLFSEPFFSPKWNRAPYHAINLTSVNDGALVVAAQFVLDSGEERYYRNILDYRPDLSMSLSTAVSLSTRVPYLTPAGYLPPMVEVDLAIGGAPDILQAQQLVDGAYFDNSGSLTALEVAGRVRQHLQITGKSKLYEIFILQFGNVSFARGVQRGIIHDFLVPLVALDKSRVSHRVQIEDPVARRGGPRLFNTELFESFQVLSHEAPMSWVLSSITKKRIESYFDRLDGECPQCGTGGDGAHVGPVLVELRGGEGMNNLTARCIFDAVSGRRYNDPSRCK
jgi:hypothetical protein